MRVCDREFIAGLVIGGIFILCIALVGFGAYSEKESGSAVIDGDKISQGLSESQQLEIIQDIQRNYPQNAVYTTKYPRPNARGGVE